MMYFMKLNCSPVKDKMFWVLSVISLFTAKVHNSIFLSGIVSKKLTEKSSYDWWGLDSWWI